MTLGESMTKDQEERAEFLERQRAKCGDYTADACPNCTRHRIMFGDDKKRRCEKCCWCIEDNGYDYDLLDVSR